MSSSAPPHPPGRQKQPKDPYAVKKQFNYHILAPLVYAPILPLIRIGLRGRLPQGQIDIIFGAGVLTALGHAGYIMSSDSTV